MLDDIVMTDSVSRPLDWDPDWQAKLEGLESRWSSRWLEEDTNNGWNGSVEIVDPDSCKISES